MYIPQSFAENDQALLFEFIDRHSFGLLVSQQANGLFASHLPMQLAREIGPNGTLLTHVARANSQWRELAGQRLLAVFSGPHVYVSPRWYGAQNVVPTWNYVAVHAEVTAELVENPVELRMLLSRLVAKYEGADPGSWTPEWDAAGTQGLLAQIVGLRLRIDRLEGKFKLSQNQPLERRHRVIAALELQTDENSAEIAELMRQGLPMESRRP